MEAQLPPLPMVPPGTVSRLAQTPSCSLLSLLDTPGPEFTFNIILWWVWMGGMGEGSGISETDRSGVHGITETEC